MPRQLLMILLLLVCLPGLADQQSQQPTFLGELPSDTANNLQAAANKANDHAQKVFGAVKQARASGANSATANLETQLKNTIRAFESFRIQSGQRIIQLEEQNRALRERAQNLSRQLAEYSQNASTTVLQLNPQPKPVSEESALVNKISHLLNNFDIKLSLGLLFLALLLLFWLIWRPSTSKEKKGRIPGFKKNNIVVEPEFDSNDKQAETNPDDEYDFLGSREGIPAKLDLARAYIDMGENVSAMEILKDVLAKGDPAQQVEAESLLNQVVV